MANFYGTAITNFANFENISGLREYCNSTDLDLIFSADKSKVMIASASESGWPSLKQNKDGELVEIQDLYSDISQFLADEQVLVFMSCGNEGRRYVSGEAHAQDNKGNITAINLYDILPLVSELWPESTISLP